MIAERELIRRIRKMVMHGSTTRAPWVLAGIGDDCAILRVKPGYEVLVTTDFSLEGVHFRRDWLGPAVIGHRCLLRGLSDIAAMGGEPVAAFLSLALPRSAQPEWVGGFLAGLLKLAKQHGVVLAGGDVAQSPAGILADIVVVGQAPKGKALRRSGAKAGDGIYVTGELGGAAEQIEALRARPARGRAGYKGPMPRIEVGQALRGIASACIDVSDGLSTDLSHICEESGVGAVIEAQAVPVAKGASLRMALHGGDDYELLFTSPMLVPEKIAGVKVTLIGEVVKGKKMQMAEAGGRRKKLEVKGWEHFRP